MHRTDHARPCRAVDRHARKPRPRCGCLTLHSMCAMASLSTGQPLPAAGSHSTPAKRSAPGAKRCRHTAQRKQAGKQAAHLSA